MLRAWDDRGIKESANLFAKLILGNEDVEANDEFIKKYKELLDSMGLLNYD